MTAQSYIERATIDFRHTFVPYSQILNLHTYGLAVRPLPLAST